MSLFHRSIYVAFYKQFEYNNCINLNLSVIVVLYKDVMAQVMQLASFFLIAGKE